MSYLRAMEEQLALLERENRSRSQPVTKYARLWGQPEAAREFARALQLGAPYAWAWQICELIELSAPTIPPWNLRTTDLVTPNGFAWFDEPLPLEDPYGTKAGKGNSSNGAYGLSGRYMVGFCWLSDADAIWVYSLYTGNRVIMQGGHEFGGAARLGRAFRWSFGRPIREMVLGALDERHAPRIYRELDYLSACFLFLTQRVVRVQRQPTPLRRPQAVGPRRLEPQPIVRAVQLRRIASGPPSDTPAERVAWSHRWLVSAHWRQQFYPATQDHRPVLILPYVKGPEEKPLKPPPTTIYAVVR